MLPSASLDDLPRRPDFAAEYLSAWDLKRRRPWLDSLDPQRPTSSEAHGVPRHRPASRRQGRSDAFTLWSATSSNPRAWHRSATLHATKGPAARTLRDTDLAPKSERADVEPNDRTASCYVRCVCTARCRASWLGVARTWSGIANEALTLGDSPIQDVRIFLPQSGLDGRLALQGTAVGD